MQTPQVESTTDVYHPGSSSGTDLETQEFMFELDDFEYISIMDTTLFEPISCSFHDFLRYQGHFFLSELSSYKGVGNSGVYIVKL